MASPAAGPRPFCRGPGAAAPAREVRSVSAADGARDWDAFASGTATLVLLGAASMIEQVAKALVAAGRDPQTPVMITSRGTTAEQDTVVSTLERIAVDAKTGTLSAQAITVVGETGPLRERAAGGGTRPGCG